MGGSVSSVRSASDQFDHDPAQLIASGAGASQAALLTRPAGTG